MLTIILTCIWFTSIPVAIFCGFGYVYNVANIIAKSGPLLIIGSLLL